MEWTAPPECPDREDFVDLVERALGEDPNVNLTATADVTRAAGVFRALLRVTSSAGFGRRVLENPRCELLAESVALVIALSTPHSSARRRSADERARGGLVPALSAHAGAAVGPLPRIAIGAGAAVAVEGFAALRIELGGTYYAHQAATFEGMNLGARFTLIGIGVRGCRLFPLGAFELAPCLGARSYVITGEGFGGMLSRDGASLLWGPTLGVFGRLQILRRLAVYLAADGVVPIARRRFVFSDVGPLHRPAPLGLSLFAGPEVRF